MRDDLNNGCEGDSPICRLKNLGSKTIGSSIQSFFFEIIDQCNTHYRKMNVRSNHKAQEFVEEGEKDLGENSV